MWYKTWFDTEFYHELYDHRDELEANLFIKNIIEYLGVSQGSNVLDLACGRGRHSRELLKYNLKVLGVDLSANSIEFASKFSSENLTFKIGDMRDPQGIDEFDYVFSLFTSFGYFETQADHLKMLTSVYASLKKSGVYLLDFLNANKVREQFSDTDKIGKTEEKNDYIFESVKFIESNAVHKNITIRHKTDKGDVYTFRERVELFSDKDLKQMLVKCGFTIKDVFGDYALTKFNAEKSHRCIVVAEK